MSELGDIAEQVKQRAAALLPPKKEIALDDTFVKQCLDANERGDGVLFATLHSGEYLYNLTPKDGEWYRWAGNVWEVDHFRRSMAAVEDCAIRYQGQHESLRDDIEEDGIDKNHPDAWKIKLAKKYEDRASRLRSSNGVARTLEWAPIVDRSMAVRESDFDQHPWLLPVKNGVIDLKTGALINGRPEDRLTRALDIDYDPHADYQPWVDFIREISDDDEVASFIKRSLGYAITGHAYEQYIWVFTGPGRNGKGSLFDLVGDIMGPYYHEISRAMLLEQKNEPSPSAASEHLYSLLGKRLIVGSETNKGQRIDASAVKSLTGEDLIKCRPLFRSEVIFKPTHSIFLQTNHIPVGLTKDFALVQRLIKVEFPYMYVDDVAEESKRWPALAKQFRPKDKHLKERLRQVKPGILRWLVEGCLEWQQIGLSPPASIKAGVEALARDEDYVGQFMGDCLVPYPDSQSVRLSCTEMYDAFKWWWSQNMDARDQRLPSMRSVNSAIRDRGHSVEKHGGKTWIYRHVVNPDLQLDIDAYVKTHKS